jgi:ubiquinone/menaquinone biosynthesis C-methylase UbiE
MRDENETARLTYWNGHIPWAFTGDDVSYEEKRRLRYSLQDYMHDSIGFDSYKSKLVIELGSGGGIDSAEFVKCGAEVISLDFTETGTRTTQKLLESANLSANVVKSSALRLPFREKIFDCVYSFGVLHHIPEIRQVLDESFRILKPDGVIICMLYNRNSMLYAYSILDLHSNEGLGEEERLRMYSERSLGCPYTRAYTKKEALDLFKTHFDDVRAEIKYNVIDLPDRRKFKLNLPERYELGWHIIVKARRRRP